MQAKKIPAGWAGIYKIFKRLYFNFEVDFLEAFLYSSVAT